MMLAGALCLGFVALAYLDGALASQAAVDEFADDVDMEESAAPDQTLWSERAKKAYASVLGQEFEPVGLLKVVRLELTVPVFMGTSPLTLNRGAGVIEGTAAPGEIGNIGISGHRDSFFRALKDIAVGDLIELRSKHGMQSYRVANLSIVDPLDVAPIEPSTSPMLTIITCHPFYYVGSAPDRFVVRALPVESTLAAGD
jgi:sortase A